MNKSQKEKINNLYSMQPIESQEDLEKELKNLENVEIKEKRKKEKDREKRIKEKKKKENEEIEKFDFDTETVIGMTQKNNRKKELERKKIVDKNERRRMKRIKRIKKILKWTMIILIIAGGITFAMVSPIFNIQEIQVNNNQYVTSDTIKSLSGLSEGQNIFRFINSQIEENIKEEPYIESAKVSRVLPNKINIEVEERKRDFSLEFLNGYAYINNQGYILEINNDKAGLPVIQGATTKEENIVPGNRLETEDLERLEVAIQILNACKSQGLDGKVTSIDITDKNEYSIYMEEEKKTIYLGDGSNLGDKILWVQAILKDNEGKEGEIYLNGDLNNNFKPRFKEKVTV